MSGTGKSGSKFAYYACANKRRGTKTCDKKNVRKDDIETVVVQRTLDTILTDEIMEQIADAAVRLQEAERDTSVLDGLKSRLRETEKALQNFVKAIEMGIFNETTASRMEQLEAEKKDLINLIELEQIEKPFITKDQILYILDCFRHGDPSDESFREHIIDVFISKVYLYDDNRLKIIYTYNNQSEESDFPSDFPENENEAETHPGHNAGMCSTSHNLVEQIHPNANTSIYINTRCIMLLTFFHVSTK